MSIEISLEQYQIEKKYTRNNKPCYFDPVREIFILENPEEIIRQKLILYLQNEMKVPLDKIEVEVPMADFQAGVRGRADIIIYGLDEEGIKRPVLVVECKAPNVPITDDVFDQVARYNRTLYADTLMLTNGTTTEIWSWDDSDDDNKGFDELIEVPTYTDLVTKQNLVFDNRVKDYWTRPNFLTIHTDSIIQQFRDYGWLGESTPSSLYPFLINLGGFIQDNAHTLEPQILNGINIVEDGGIRHTTFGNAAGGSWTGDYRYFILEDDEGNNQIISFAIFGSLKCENHPTFGNRRGHTTLVVAIDDFDKRHNALQLNLDDYTLADGNKYTIWHDGKITVGKSGASKKSEIINFIREHSPDLLDNQGRVFLGSFDNSKEITWNQEETKKFVGRLLKYAIVRDKFRNYKQNLAV